MVNKIASYFRDFFLKAVRTIYLIPELWDEMKWSRSVAYVCGPTNIQYPVVPISHADRWPFVRTVDPAIQERKPDSVKNATVTDIKAPRRSAKGTMK